MPNRANRSPRARVLTAVAIALPVMAAAALVQTKAFAESPTPNGSDTLHSYVCTYVYANDLWKLRNGNNADYVKNSVLLDLTANQQQSVSVGDIFHAGTGNQSVLYVVMDANLTEKLPNGEVPNCPVTPPVPNPSPSSPETTPSTPVTSEEPPSGTPSSPETTPSNPETTPSNPETTPSNPETTPSNPVTSETPPPATTTAPSSPATTPSSPETTPSSPETSATTSTTPTSPMTSVTAPPASPTSSATTPATSLPKTGN